MVAIDHVAGEVIVGAILDDELHLVVRREAIEVLPVVPVRLAAAGALDVDDLPHGRRNAVDRPVSSRLQHDRPARGKQPIHQRIHVLLQQRLAARDFDEPTLVLLHSGHDVVDRHLAPLVKRVRRIAPGAAQIARRQPHEHARFPRARRFALDRVEDLVDRKHKNRGLVAGPAAGFFPAPAPSSQPQLASTIVPWRSRLSTGSPPERHARTPEVFWTSKASTWSSSTSTKSRRRASSSRSTSERTTFSIT